MNLQTKTIRAGTHLFHENERSRQLYIIQTGSVKVYRRLNGREVELAILGKGAVLGEMALIDGRPRSASARALDDGAVIVVDADAFHERIKGVPPWFLTLIKMTCQKIRNANRLLQSMGGGRHGINIILALFYEFCRAGETLDAAAAGRRLQKILGVSEESVGRIYAFLRQHGFIEFAPPSIRIVDTARYADYGEFLRLFIQKYFERQAPVSEQVRTFILELVKQVPALQKTGKDESAETSLDGGALWGIIESVRCGAGFRNVLDPLESCGVLSVAKQETPENRPPEEKGKNPIADSVFKINNALVRQWFLYFTFNRMIPVL